MTNGVRISLRWLMFVIAAVSVLMYVGVARPKMLANHFVAAMNAQDMDGIDAFLADKNWRDD
jgi:hypothetical protein